MRRQGQVLLIDADDTLWETNLRFRRTLDAFCELVAPLGYSDGHVRRAVDAAERARIPRSGYGEQKFLHTPATTLTARSWKRSPGWRATCTKPRYGCWTALLTPWRIWRRGIGCSCSARATAKSRRAR
jgi:hypothetical protein